MRQRLAVVVGTLFAVALVGTAAPAQARGCQAFGTRLAVDAQSTLLGGYVSENAPASGLIHGLQFGACGG